MSDVLCNLVITSLTGFFFLPFIFRGTLRYIFTLKLLLIVVELVWLPAEPVSQKP